MKLLKSFRGRGEDACGLTYAHGSRVAQYQNFLGMASIEGISICRYQGGGFNIRVG